MLEFIIIVSAFILMALLFVVPTLFKVNRLPAENYDQRNTQIARERLDDLKQSLTAGEISQENFDIAREELDKNLAIDLSTVQQSEQEVENSAKPMGIVLIALVPVLSAILYMQIGHPDAINGQPETQAKQAQHSAGDQPKMSMQEALSKLSSRLKENPEDPQGWFMLARTYMAMNRYQEAATAYEETIKRVDEDADLLVRYADALAMANEGVLNGKPREAIEKALSLNPQHQQGLWLFGIAAIEANDFKLALKQFLILQPMLASNPDGLSQLHGMIARAEKNLTEAEIKLVQASLPASTSPASTSPASSSLVSKPNIKTEAANSATKASADKAEIQVVVSLDKSLMDKASAQDVVFIYAKAMSGPPMPLAAVRKTVAELPITVTLNDAMAMMPAMKLSAYSQVKVGAKISKSGVAGPSAGDLFGEIQNINVKSSEQISVVINTVR